MADVYASIVLIIFSSSFLVITNNFTQSKNIVENIGPRVWPQAILAVILVLSILLLITSLQQRKEKGRNIDFQVSDLIIMIKLVGIVVVYIILMKYIGFILSTIVFTLSLTTIVYRINFKQAFLFSVGATVAYVIVFILVFNLPLPRGIALFRTLSYLIY